MITTILITLLTSILINNSINKLKSPKPGKRVILESPFFHPDPAIMQKYAQYLDSCMAHSLLEKNESPFASHTIYTKHTDDRIPEQRTKGINAGLEWSSVSDYSVVYVDHNLSKGMIHGIKRAMSNGKRIEYRSLYRELSKEEIKELQRKVISTTTVDSQGNILTSDPLPKRPRTFI